MSVIFTGMILELVTKYLQITGTIILLNYVKKKKNQISCLLLLELRSGIYHSQKEKLVPVSTQSIGNFIHIGYSGRQRKVK